MTLKALGIAVFGAAAILYGVIALLWHDADTWQSLHRLLETPTTAIAGNALMLLSVVAGIALLVTPVRRFGAIGLAVAFACGALVAAVAAVANVMDYDAFFEQLSMLCGALALRNVRFARIGFGLSVVSFTVTQAIHLGGTARLVPKWLPPGQMFWAILTTVAFALAAIAILTNLRATLALRLTACMTAVFGLFVWLPILIQAPYAHLAWSEFAITVLVTGAALCVSEAQTSSDVSHLF
ncbi:MAG TPA: hypothetical protein VFN49_01480 [Candidatus Aquilonibacter sp.]|nr:hypothetical protein [Candidatus Aquilonibacter sp.]